MKVSSLIVYFILIASLGLCQAELVPEPSRPKNGIGVNIFGDGALGSILYNRVFLKSADMAISTELGIGYNEGFCLFGCDSRQQYVIVPLKATANFGKEKHFLEIGIGTSILFGNNDQLLVFYPILGYRLLPLYKNRIGFRINLELPIGTHLKNSDSIFQLGGNMPFLPFGIAFDFWF